MITPLIAFAPDINGVCSIAGTFEMTSSPRKMAKTMIKMLSLFSKKYCKTCSITGIFKYFQLLI